MDTNAIADYVSKVEDQLWVDKVNEAYMTNKLCPWVSTFHPRKLPCNVDGTFYYGAFNAGMKVVFPDGTAWMLRFPRGGKIPKCYIDEKVAMEVKALSMIREKTTVPVPEIKAWGLESDNSLGLGPFMIMDFIDGVSLSDILEDPKAENPTRLMREDFEDDDLELVYRQFANILLQLFQLDFQKIGSLPAPTDRTIGTTPRRPLTFKAHSILQNGGVNTFGDRSQAFATTTEYLQYLVEQDLKQLDLQPNSTTGRYDAENKYKSFRALRSLIPDFVNPNYDRGGFKLICDDLGLANLIVRSATDLTIIGVVDFEWSYVGPAQLAASAPWWLLQDRPVNSAWDCRTGQPLPKTTERYFRYLEIFMRALEEEETRLRGGEEKEFSNLVKWSQTSGAMWLHMLLTPGFMDQESFPFNQLRNHLGDKWVKRVAQFQDARKIEAFAARKVHELDKYDEALEKTEKDIELVVSGEMSKEQFLFLYKLS